MNENECNFAHLIKDTLRSNEVRVELIFSADDNEHAPESLISLSMKYEKESSNKCIVNISVSDVRDEFTFSASGNDDAPESPILFLVIQK